jgi:meso-butanediol dehydrogenase/(S,S)-butanediol dehydrogenase/diacetyl reductase
VAEIGGLDGAVAVVTGGASGIGEACCRLLLRAGATVHVADLATDPPLDVTDRSALDALAGRLNGVDVLINAAGVLTENRPVDELSVEDFRRNFEINVLGTVQACQAFGPLLRERGGAVVNVASQAALVSLPSQAAYTASKGAVAALTRSLAIDWAEHGVRVNAVAPGFTVTPMTASFFENETFVRAATRRIPLGRLLEPDEIAGAIVFLASPLASAITGVVLPVDGGWTAGEPALPW